MEWNSGIPLCGYCMEIAFSAMLYLSIYQLLDCFHFMGFMSNVAMNIHVEIFV